MTDLVTPLTEGLRQTEPTLSDPLPARGALGHTPSRAAVGGGIWSGLLSCRHPTEALVSIPSAPAQSPSSIPVSGPVLRTTPRKGPKPSCLWPSTSSPIDAPFVCEPTGNVSSNLPPSSQPLGPPPSRSRPLRVAQRLPPTAPRSRPPSAFPPASVNQASSASCEPGYPVPFSNPP
eukprot:1253962-Rhodomonas_salina.5